jgi:hypothetical protein
MIWILQRFSDDTKSTLGLLFKQIFIESEEILHFFCFVLEDEHRDVKVMEETRIPAGKYQLKILKADTPLTVKHRISYNKGYKTPWFVYHIEITGIPNFSGVYMHAGIFETHTAGCPLLAYGAQKVNDAQSLSMSTIAVKDWYAQVYEHLNDGGEAWLDVRDEKTIIN